MNRALITAEEVVIIHDRVLNEGELAGLAGDKSLEGALARVDHRVHYGHIQDEYDLAANYAMAIATGHCFNDANKRTAYTALLIVLHRNRLNPEYDEVELADYIISLAQGAIDADTLAEYLRTHTSE
jgi:death-on-curing protein